MKSKGKQRKQTGRQKVVSRERQDSQGVNRWITNLYIIFLFMIYPLIFHHRFIDIMETKTISFVVASVAFLGFSVVGWMIFTPHNTQNRKRIQIDFSDICFLILAACAIFSGVFSGNLGEDFLCRHGKMFGMLVFLLCISTYFIISRTFYQTQVLLWSCLIGTLVTCFFIILNRAGIDPLHFYDKMLESQKIAFFGTLGHNNVVSGMMCCLLPFWFGNYYFGEEKGSRIIFGLTTILVMITGICVKADSFYLGIAGTVLFYLLLNIIQRRKSVLFYLGMVIVILITGIFFYQQAQWHKIFVFQDSWGSNRGYVWRKTMELFLKQPLYKKIIGCGTGSFASFFASCKEESMAFCGEYFVDAHSEALQMLVTEGIVGVSAYYLGILFLTIKSVLQKKETISIIFAGVFMVYLLQGLVNNPNVYTTPYLFAFLGMTSANLKQSKMD